MLFRHMMAGALTVFGLAGLTMASVVAPPDAEASSSGYGTVSLAITSGSHLHLMSVTDTDVSKPGSKTTKLICHRVYRLAFANIGFSCQSSGAQSASAPALKAATIAMAKGKQ